MAKPPSYLDQQLQHQKMFWQAIDAGDVEAAQSLMQHIGMFELERALINATRQASIPLIRVLQEPLSGSGIALALVEACRMGRLDLTAELTERVIGWFDLKKAVSTATCMGHFDILNDIYGRLEQRAVLEAKGWGQTQVMAAFQNIAPLPAHQDTNIFAYLLRQAELTDNALLLSMITDIANTADAVEIAHEHLRSCAASTSHKPLNSGWLTQLVNKIKNNRDILDDLLNTATHTKQIEAIDIILSNTPCVLTFPKFLFNSLKEEYRKEIECLMQYDNINWKELTQKGLRVTIALDEVDTLSILLPRIDPKWDNSHLLCTAASKQAWGIVTLLLPHSDATANDSFALQMASHHHQSDMVDMLWEHSNPESALQAMKQSAGRRGVHTPDLPINFQLIEARMIAGEVSAHHHNAPKITKKM